MLSIDLFDSKYEKRLHEGAVDDLEARRIDLLNDRMQDLLARAKESGYRSNPAALSALKKQFQQVKDERDSYYKIREESHMYKGPHGRQDVERKDGVTRVTRRDYDDSTRDTPRSKYFPNKDLKGQGTGSAVKSGSGISSGQGSMRKRPRLDHDANDAPNYGVDEAGIPGNVPTEKIPGKEDLLKGKGRSYYESQKKNSEAVDEHGGGIGPRQHWQDLMPEQMNPEDYDDYEDEDEDLRLRSGDYVRDRMDGESGEVFRMQGDPNERRVQILDRDGRGWYITTDRLTRVDPDDINIQRYFGKRRQRDMDESGVAEADETSWTANSAQFRKEEDMSWPVKITLEPNADINQGRGRQVKTMTVTGQSRDAAKKKLVDYFLKNGWTVTGIKFTGDLDEARRVKGGDYQLKLVDKQSDDDTDLDDVVMDYYFDVYQNGKKIGTAEGDSYYGELVVKPEFDRQFKLSSFHDKDHPLMQQFEKIENGVAESATAPIIVPKRRAKEKKPTKFHIPHKASDYVPPALAMASAEALDRIIADPSTRETTRELAKKARAEKKKGVAEGIDDDVEHLANVAADAYWSGKFGMTSATEKVKMARDIVQAVEDGRLSIEELRQDIRDLDNKGVAEEASRDYLKPQWPDQRALPKAVAKLLLQYAKQNKKSINRLIKASPFDLIDVIVEINPEFAEDNLDHLSDNDFNWVFLKATEMIAKSIQKQGVAEGMDQQRYIIKRINRDVGEIGIDRESSPGVGQWYMKCYLHDIYKAGYDSKEEALADLKYCLTHDVTEGATVAYTVLVVDPETYEKKKLNISALTKEHAKEEAESKGYKVLRVDSEQGVAEGIVDTIRSKNYARLADRSADKRATALDNFDEPEHQKQTDIMKQRNLKSRLLNKKGVAEGENQEYTVRVVDEEGSGYTVKVTATSEQGALHKAIVKVRNSGARPEHARIIRQGVAEGSEHNVGDTVNYSTKVAGFSKSAQGGQGKITKKTATHYTINGKEMPHGHVKSKSKGVAEADSGDYDYPYNMSARDKGRYDAMTGREYNNPYSAFGTEEDHNNAIEYSAAYDSSNKQGVAEGWSDKYGGVMRPPTPYSVYIKGKKWKDFATDDHAQAVANKLKAKFRADGRDPETITIAPTNMSEAQATKTRLDPKCWSGKKIGTPKTKVKGGVRVNNCVPAESIQEDQDTSGVESAIIRRIMVSHTDLLRQFGPEKVMQAAEEVAYNVGDVDEIGTSDVSAYVAQVKQILGAV
jgi:hypothetical protein